MAKKKKDVTKRSAEDEAALAAQKVSAEPDEESSTAHVPADPVEAKNKLQHDLVEEAIAAIDAELETEEEAGAAAVLEARTFFQSFRFSEPFRFVVAAAYKAGHGKKPL